ncbi:accessory factor associated with RNA polymerase II [Diaporthe eres]|uniref:Accessory factor associated with RNA polymerase II n=1 Tax=Diaporthe eres TaxID=83184 RepID=A0ABR1PKI9_DIAER
MPLYFAPLLPSDRDRPCAQTVVLLTQLCVPLATQSDSLSGDRPREDSNAIMAAAAQDPLLLFRQAIASAQPVTPVAGDSADEAPLSQATQIRFADSTALPIDSPTRFQPDESTTIDLRSIYFAWVNRDLAIPDYNAAATALNEELAAKGLGATVHKLAFVERVDLITWLEGGGESEYIKKLPGDAAPAAAEALKSSSQPTASARAGKGSLDPRLQQIYAGERKMGDRNTALRGVKPIDFSGVRKHATLFTTRKPGQPPAPTAAAGGGAALPINQKPAKRPDPIILLSPSASSLLRISNVRAFLETGRYELPESGSTATMLNIMRVMREIDPNRAMRFILVEGPENFKPEYWNRVVAVFTTGQPWQFKNYKWSNPNELFRHVLGVHVGWRGDQVPDNVRNWGHRVQCFTVDKWRDPGLPGAEASRFRDREIVESIWKQIENNMRSKGWRKDAAPASI